MKLIHEDLTYQLRGIFYQTHNALGPGFDEKLYRDICFEKCNALGIEAKKEEEIRVRYKGHEIATFFLDLLAADKVIVEFKALDAIASVHKAQLICYLRATNLAIGLLVNFSFRGVEIDRLANFPQPVKTVAMEDYFSFDSLRRTDSSDKVVETAIEGICEVWNELSYGYLESVYYRALEVELDLAPFALDQELAFEVLFDGKLMGTQQIKSVLNSDIWVVFTSTTKPRQGLEKKIRSILKSTSLSCAILATFSGKRPLIQIIKSEIR